MGKDCLLERTCRLKTWLLIDTNNLCWRMAHSLAKRYPGDDAVGITSLAEVKKWIDWHSSTGCVFAFDSGKPLRKVEHPFYKANRASITADEAEMKRRVNQQILDLRLEWLRKAGFNNVFWQEGYEADDVIASVARDVPSGAKAIIVTTDTDLFQCASERVSVWNPITYTATTPASMLTKFGVGPERWAEVKALAGCSSDGIRGVEGVGEKTACKHLNGKLPEHVMASKKIRACGDEIKRNLGLVKLPWPGTAKFDLEADDDSDARWKAVAMELGVDTKVFLG